MQTTANEVTLELKALDEIGVRVPKAAFDYVTSHVDEIEEYRTNGMSISEIADLVRDLA